MEQLNTKRAMVGDAILAKAQMVDTKPIRARLSSFAETHRSYCAAQRKVDEAERQRLATDQRLEQLDTAQIKAIEALAVALVNEGEPRSNPFERFTTCAPGQMKKLLYVDEVKAVREIVAAVNDNKSLLPATKALGDTAARAADALEAALPELDASERNLETARQMRDPLERDWDSSYAVLRSITRTIGKAEAPGLFGKLFGHTLRNTHKASADTQPPPNPAPSPAPTTTGVTEAMS